MQKRWLCIFLVYVSQAAAQSSTTPPDSFAFRHDSGYLAMDRNFRDTGSGILDTITNDSLLKSIIAPYHFITNNYTEKSLHRLQLPTVKEIQVRPVKRDSWKFWIICLVLLYISFIRILNTNNFKVFLQSVFNLKLSEKIWDDQRSIFNFVILQLFAIYLLIAALFINYVLELKNIRLLPDFLLQYFVIVGLLAVIYLGKFILHGLLGMLLKMRKLGIGFVANTVSVNNFLSLIILPFIVFMIYNENKLWSLILIQTVTAIFFISILYRMVRIVLLSHTFFSFPKVYLFIYLCALEITPWFVIIKFINQYPI